MKRRKRAGPAVAMGLGLGALALLVASSPGPRVESAWIEAFEGDAGQYAIVPGDAGAPGLVQPFRALHEGDRIVVKGPGGAITIRLSDDRVLGITVADSPFLVPARAQAPGIVSNLMAWVEDAVTRAVRQDGSTVSLTSRGEGEFPLSVPLLEHERVRVTPHESLELAWLGGRPPYAVVLRAEAGPVAQAGEIEAARTRLRGTRAPGVYRLEVRDAEGSVQACELEVVSDDGLPRAPAHLVSESEAEPDAFRQVLHAVWLAGQGEGEWSLEAYQRLSALAPATPQAGAVALALETGDLPPKGPVPGP